MTSERVMGIRHGYEGWNRGEPDPADAARAFELASDFEFHPPSDLLGERVYRGEGATAEFLAAVQQSFERVQISPVEVRELGEHVLVRAALEATGRHSGVEVARDEYHVFTFEGELLRSIRAFPSEGEALDFIEAKGATQN